MKIQRHWLACLDMLRSLGSPRLAAEIGCASGANAAMMLREFPSLTLWMVDPWQADPEYVADILEHRKGSAYLAKTTLDQAWFDEQLRLARAATDFAGDRRVLLRMGSLEAAKLAGDGTFDLGFLDGDHRKKPVAADIRAWWLKVRSGGILAGHDYGTVGHAGVKLAVDAWAEEMGANLEFPEARCWMVRK